MSISRFVILKRGLSQECPNCGAATLFKERGYFSPSTCCSSCQQSLETGEGTFLGPMTINYGIVVFGLVLPTLALAAFEVIGFTSALVATLIIAVFAPLALYRISRSLWLMCYYYFLPQLLFANQVSAKSNEPTKS